MAKKNIFVLFVFFIFLIIILLLAAFVVYEKNLFPDFTFFIDRVLKNESSNIETDILETKFIQIDSGEIAQSKIFVYQIRDTEVLKNLEPYFHNTFIDETNSFSMQYSKEQKTFKLQAMFQRLSEDFDPLDESLSTWTYRNVIPLTAAALFQDAFVFIDAKPALKILDLKTGALRYSLDSPFYPSSFIQARKLPLYLSKDIENQYKSFVQENKLSKNETLSSSLPFIDFQKAVPQFIVKGADGKVYSFAFLDEAVEEALSTFSFHNTRKNSQTLMPSQAIQNEMMKTVLDWAEFSQMPFFIEPIVLPTEPRALSVNEEGISIFALMFKDEGRYQLGLSDKNSDFIRANAIVFLFSAFGEMLSISVDYESEKPQIQVLLDTNTLYYIVIANKGNFPLKDGYFSYKKLN